MPRIRHEGNLPVALKHLLAGRSLPAIENVTLMNAGTLRLAQLVLPRRLIFRMIASGMFVGRALATPASLSFVTVIPSIHKLLAGNPRYNYENLYSLVAAFQPDRVGVEIRQEDLARPAPYLRHNYPTEMTALAEKYAGRTFGFDWLGTELQGRPIPR